MRLPGVSLPQLERTKAEALIQLRELSEARVNDVSQSTNTLTQGRCLSCLQPFPESTRTVKYKFPAPASGRASCVDVCRGLPHCFRCGGGWHWAVDAASAVVGDNSAAQRTFREFAIVDC